MVKDRRQKGIISSSIIKIIEEIFRSSPYGYGLSRYLAGRFFYKIFGEVDFRYFSKINFEEDEVFLDVGANDGISALTFRLFNKSNKIISFEPDEKHKSSLDRVARKIKNFQYFLFGLGNKNEVKKLFIPSCKGVYIGQLASYIFEEAKNNVKAIITEKNIDQHVKIIEKNVETKTIDSLNLKPRAIKVDVEGFEFEVLQGSINTLKKYNPVLMIEVNNSSINQVLKFLKDLNYSPFVYLKDEDKLKKFYENQNSQDNFVINLFFLSPKDQNLAN